MAEKEARDPSVPMVVLRPPTRQSFPMRSPPPAGCGRHCRIGWPICPAGRSASPCCRPIRRRSKVMWRRPRAPRAKERRHDRRSHASCLRPLRGHRPHAASGNPLRSGSGSAPAAVMSSPTNTAFLIYSNIWPSRAPSGAARARLPRRSRRSAAISTPPPARNRLPIMPACSKRTCRWRSTCSPTS